MHWFSYRALHLMRGMAKFVAASATFTIGLMAKRVVDRLLSQSPPLTASSFLQQASSHTTLLGIAVVTLVLLIVAKFIEIYYLERWIRDAAIIGTSMRHLYGRLFGQESGHRVTFLAKRHPWDRYIRPRYRYAYGEGFKVKSKARFEKGSALAGLAWKNPGGDKVVSEPNIPDFKGSEQDFLVFYRSRFNMSEDEAMRLSSGTRTARWLFSYGIVHPSNHRCIGVLCIDSDDPNALAKVDVGKVLEVSSIIASLVKKV